MSNGKSSTLWKVNVISLILFVILCGTGLLNWMVLPKGYAAKSSFLVSVRHFLVTIHEWVGLIFIIVTIIHLVLHWAYIKSNLKKYGIMK